MGHKNIRVHKQNHAHTTTSPAANGSSTTKLVICGESPPNKQPNNSQNKKKPPAPRGREGIHTEASLSGNFKPTTLDAPAPPDQSAPPPTGATNHPSPELPALSPLFSHTTPAVHPALGSAPSVPRLASRRKRRAGGERAAGGEKGIKKYGCRNRSPAPRARVCNIVTTGTKVRSPTPSRSAPIPSRPNPSGPVLPCPPPSSSNTVAVGATRRSADTWRKQTKIGRPESTEENRSYQYASTNQEHLLDHSSQGARGKNRLSHAAPPNLERERAGVGAWPPPLSRLPRVLFGTTTQT